LSQLGKFHNNEEVEMVVCEWFQIQGPDFFSDEIFKVMPTRENSLVCFGMMAESNSTFTELMSYPIFNGVKKGAVVKDVDRHVLTPERTFHDE
jgi:hypothetical protein